MSTSNIKVFFKLPTNASSGQATGWLDTSTAAPDESWDDDDGCLEGSLDSSLPARNTVTTGTRYISDDDWIVIKIEASSSWTGNISSMVADWG